MDDGLRTKGRWHAIWGNSADCNANGVKKQKTKDPETKRTIFSKNYEKQRLKVARKHQQIADIRRDIQHKFTTELARTCGVMGIEDLNILGMMANRNLARAVADAAMGQLLQFLKSKEKLRSSRAEARGSASPPHSFLSQKGRTSLSPVAIKANLMPQYSRSERTSPVFRVMSPISQTSLISMPPLNSTVVTSMCFLPTPEWEKVRHWGKFLKHISINS